MSALPPIEIKPSRMTELYAVSAILIPLLVVLGPPLLEGGGIGWDEISGALYGFGALIIVGGGTAVAMIRAQGRARERLLAEAPAGSVLATYASPLKVMNLDEGRRRQRFDGRSAGVLVVGTEGITFRKKKTDPAKPEVHLAWSEIERVETERENPFRLFLRAHTRTRQVHAWQVPGAHAVEAALRSLRDGPTC